MFTQAKLRKAFNQALPFILGFLSADLAENFQAAQAQGANVGEALQISFQTVEFARLGVIGVILTVMLLIFNPKVSRGRGR